MPSGNSGVSAAVARRSRLRGLRGASALAATVVVVAAAIVLQHSTATTALENRAGFESQQLSVAQLAQQIVAANPDMTPAEAQQQVCVPRNPARQLARQS